MQVMIAALFPIAGAVLLAGIKLRKRDSLLARRVAGGAFIAGLILLGLAFPAII
jgi:hypothetical protein